MVLTVKQKHTQTHTHFCFLFRTPDSPASIATIQTHPLLLPHKLASSPPLCRLAGRKSCLRNEGHMVTVCWSAWVWVTPSPLPHTPNGRALLLALHPALSDGIQAFGGSPRLPSLLSFTPRRPRWYRQPVVDNLIRLA